MSYTRLLRSSSLLASSRGHYFIEFIQVIILVVFISFLVYMFITCWILRTQQRDLDRYRYHKHPDLYNATEEEDTFLPNNQFRNLPQSYHKYSDSTIQDYYNKIKSYGIDVNIFTTKGPRPASLTLTKEEVMWVSTRPIPPGGQPHKRYKIHLEDILHIEYGKQTENFRRPLARDVADSRCMSLVCAEHSLDIELRTNDDRELVAIILTAKLDKFSLTLASQSLPKEVPLSRSRSSSESSLGSSHYTQPQSSDTGHAVDLL